MQLKMKTSLSGPFYSVVSGQVLDFDEDFPFSGDEVVRLTSDEYRYAVYLGTPEDLEAWLKADAEKRAEAAKDAGGESIAPKPDDDAAATENATAEPVTEPAPAIAAAAEPATAEPVTEPAPAIDAKASAKSSAKKA